MKKNNIAALVTIILLLIVFLPGAIYGTYMHFKTSALGGNPNKEFYYNGKLHFYDGDKLIGIYNCETDNCGYATNYIAENQSFEEYNVLESEIKIINNHYAFIKDGEKIYLYDVLTNNKIIDYKAIKNYSFGINGNYYIIKNSSDKWGMIEIYNNIKVVIPFSYDYLGLTKNITENKFVSANKLIAKSNNNWQLITNQNGVIINTLEPIHNYSNNFVVTKNNNINYIYTYSGNKVLENYIITEVLLLDYLAIAKTNTNYYLVYNANTNSVIKEYFINNDKYDFKIENNNLVVTKNNTVLETIALS